MLGTSATLIALTGLAMLSAGRRSPMASFTAGSRATPRPDKRIDQIQKAEPGGDRRQQGPGRRWQQATEIHPRSLKEMEDRQKAKAKQVERTPRSRSDSSRPGSTGPKRGYYTFSVLVAIFIAVATFFIGLPLYACAIFGAVGFLALPKWVVNFRRKRRIKKFLNEFPNAIDRDRARHQGRPALNDCIRIIANEAAEPVKSEFRTITEAQSIGLGMADASPSCPNACRCRSRASLAIVIMIQSKAGGNLSEALGNLSRVIRERKKMKGKINALSQEAKASGGIIGALAADRDCFLVYLSARLHHPAVHRPGRPRHPRRLGGLEFLGVMVMKQIDQLRLLLGGRCFQLIISNATNPQVIVAVLAALSVIATIVTLTGPLFERDKLGRGSRPWRLSGRRSGQRERARVMSRKRRSRCCGGRRALTCGRWSTNSTSSGRWSIDNTVGKLRMAGYRGHAELVVFLFRPGGAAGRLLRRGDGPIYSSSQDPAAGRR